MNSRALSAKIILPVCYEGRSLTDAFNQHLKHKNDVSFIKSLCFGTIRYWFSLQEILQKYLQKPFKKKDKDIECLLAVGVYQLLYTDTPSYAAINETVNAAKDLKKNWATGLINKILRRILSEKPKLNDKYAHPKWIINKTKNDWPSEYKDILEANNKQAPLFLRVNQTKVKLNDFKKLLTDHKIDFESIDNLTHAIKLLNPMAVEKIPGFSEGFFSVQDPCGQKVIDYLSLDNSQRVLDACCAPGSKTTLILEVFPGLKSLTAVDVSKSRLNKVSDNIKRLGLSKKHLHLIAADICDRKKWWDGNAFDRILVDAPCSASGVIRRHPDIKVLRKESDIAALYSKQLEILNTVWHTLKPGGLCVYTTCSIFKEENEQVIENFLKKHKNTRIKSIENHWGIALKYGQQVLPGSRECDGFYYAIIEKIA